MTAASASPSRSSGASAMNICSRNTGLLRAPCMGRRWDRDTFTDWLSLASQCPISFLSTVKAALAIGVVTSRQRRRATRWCWRSPSRPGTRTLSPRWRAKESCGCLTWVGHDYWACVSHNRIIFNPPQSLMTRQVPIHPIVTDHDMSRSYQPSTTGIAAYYQAEQTGGLAVCPPPLPRPPSSHHLHGEGPAEEVRF